MDTSPDKFIPLQLPKAVFGTSALGNLYVIPREETKCLIVSEYLSYGSKPIVFNTPGKYGASLAIESLILCLKQLNINPWDI